MPDESPHAHFDSLKKQLQDSILRDYPNPERKGCPGNTVLNALALRPLNDNLEEDPNWHHVTHCSECYREFLDIRRELAASRKRLVWRNRTRIAVAAMFVVAAIAGAVFWRGRPKPVAPPGIIEAEVQVDMRPFSPTRGESEAVQREGQFAAILNRKPSRLNIILPLGSEEGTYEVRFMDSDLRAVVVSGKASTSFTDHLVKLSIRFDLTRVPPGRYVLASRRDNGSWMTSPVLIR